MRKNTDTRGVFPFINKKTVYGFLLMAVILLIEMNIIFFHKHFSTVKVDY